MSLAYTEASTWRNRSEFLSGRPAIVAFLAGRWQCELEYRLIKEVWAFTGDRIGARLAYEWQDADGQWFRSHGNEQWAFDEHGLMHAGRPASTTGPSRKQAGCLLAIRTTPIRPSGAQRSWAMNAIGR